MISSSDQRDKSKQWRAFHVNHGHRINDCIVLRLEMVELLKWGQFINLLTEKGKENVTRR